MCRPPSSGRVRRRACGLPYPASGWRSRPSARLRFDRCATAPETRPLPAISRTHPPATSTDCPAVSDGRGWFPARRPRANGRCTSPDRFQRATAGYVDRPQAAMESRHRPGTAPGPADDGPSTLRAPAGDPTPITQVKVRTRAKSITGFSLSKPVPGFKTGYRFTGSRFTSLVSQVGMGGETTNWQTVGTLMT